MNGYPILDIFLSIVIFFGWVLWFMLMFWIIIDIFRSHDLSGWAKAAWLVGIIIFPLVGILAYLIVRGGSMHERQVRRAVAADAAFRDYARDAAATPGNPDTSSDELAKLASLHQRGVLNDDEFQRAKERIV